MQPWPRADPEAVEPACEATDPGAPAPASSRRGARVSAGTGGLAEAERRIERIFAERMRIEVPSVETDLFASGAVDSLIFVELVVQLEEEFGLPIPLAELELEDLRSIARIARLLTREGSAR